jgi:hypothetical protein
MASTLAARNSTLAARNSTLAARNGGRAGIATLAAILLLGLGLRADYAWEGRAPVFDAVAYGRIAENLERGEGFTLGRAATQPASNYSPGLPLLVAGLYKLSGGQHERLARLALALIGSLSILFAYLIGRRLSGPAAGLIGAAAVAVYPALLEYQGMLMGEPLAATLLSGAALSMLWAAGSESAGGAAAGAPRWLVPGALLGALALVRPESLGIAVVLAMVVLLSSAHGASFAHGASPSHRGAANAGHGPAFGPSARGLQCAAALLAAVAVVVAPWTVRNAVALGRFVPISTGGGQVLFAGTYLPSGGDPQRVGKEVLERHPGLTRRIALEHLPPDSPLLAPTAARGELERAVLLRVRLEQILAALAAQRHPGMETDRALARMGREQLWDDLTEEPLEYAGFVAAKVGAIWSHGPRDVMRRPLWQALHWALLALGLLGLAALARRRPREALLLGAVLASITAVAALLVASPRRALVALPLLAALAGVGAACASGWLAGSFRERRRFP